MAGIWTFMDYLAEDGENPIAIWLNRLSPAVKAKINARIRYVERLDVLDRPQIGHLKGPCAGLIELRVRGDDKIQYRPLCCLGPGNNQVTILVGAIEKGGKFVPLSACSTAQQRKTEIARKGRTCEHNFR